MNFFQHLFYFISLVRDPWNKMLQQHVRLMCRAAGGITTTVECKLSIGPNVNKTAFTSQRYASAVGLCCRLMPVRIQAGNVSK